MSLRVEQDGVLREFWDDGPRTYTRWGADGVLIPGTPEAPNPRPYTQAENAQADLDVAASVAAVNGSSLRVDVRAQIDTLKALIGPSAAVAGTDSLRAVKATTNATINAGPAPYIKADNQALIDLAQALVRISRLVVGALDDVSVAPQAAAMDPGST